MFGFGLSELILVIVIICAVIICAVISRFLKRGNQNSEKSTNNITPVEKTESKSMGKQKAGILGLIIGIPVGLIISFIFIVLEGFFRGVSYEDVGETMILYTIICALIGAATGLYVGKK